MQPAMSSISSRTTPRKGNLAGDDLPSFERAYLSYEVPFVLRTSSADLQQAISFVLPYQSMPLARPDDAAEVFSLLPHADGHSFRCLRGAELIAEASDLEGALEQLQTELMVHVANFAPDRVFVHAGVVAWRGRALVLPGTSFAGKTTLTAALVRAGATYYSDEYAVIDDHGHVHPYARPLQVRKPGESIQRPMAVEALAGIAGTEPLPAALVVFAQFRPGAHWEPTPLSAGLAVLEMLRHAIPVQRTPARVMATLAAMMANASASSGERGEADITAAALLAALDGRYA
jgi:hypothetical protein